MQKRIASSPSEKIVVFTFMTFAGTVKEAKELQQAKTVFLKKLQLVYVIGPNAVQFGNNRMKKIPRTAKIGRGRARWPLVRDCGPWSTTQVRSTKTTCKCDSFDSYS